MSFKILYSTFSDESIQSPSCGGGLLFQVSSNILDKIITNIESKILNDGGLFYKKLFLHFYELNNKIEIYIKKPPIIGNVFLIYYDDLLNINTFNFYFPDIINSLSSSVRFFTHFQLYESKLNKETNRLKVKCPCSIPFKSNNLQEELIPHVWKDLLWEYIPDFIKIGDKIKIFNINHIGSNEVFESKIANINNLNNCINKYKNSEVTETYFEIELEDTIPVTLNLYKENTVISNVLEIDKNNLNHGFVNFNINSVQGNYSIENFPIETNEYGTVYEKWEIKFDDNESFTLKALNNNLIIGHGNINEDFVPINNFIDYNGNSYPFFKIKKDGWLGNFHKNETLTFTTYGKEIPLWVILYFSRKLNLNTNVNYLTKDNFILEINERN